ncbi:MAG: hypothetical protein C4520_05280 [Candidatus Abyssobacteria bacterium SURF_5]|uniref:Glycosyltransferase RgtA/B/C/D-like domain-containing protein n=1 Tax=Abyssobacteria bacterium (strain SURF_5) TaxID=2093360 RepID=A0A3A4NZ58_ABYX5|nr:MAG: hypothetical protein C4520_05280 [Candidatus Abyssubacteria bacterium SURF_5]
MREIIHIMITLAAIALAYAAPFFHLRRLNRFSSIDAAVLAPAAASLLIGGIAFVTHALGLPQFALHTLILALMVLSIIPALRGTTGPEKTYRLPLVIGTLFLALILLLQAAFPIYLGGFWYFDWWQHYSLSQMYLGKITHDHLWLGMYNFASRTPLLNLNTAFFLSIFGDHFWVYQLAASLLNSIFVLPAFALCAHLTGRKRTLLIMAALFFSPSLVHNSWYPWPKLFAAYFALAAAYFYLINRKQHRFPDIQAALPVFVLIWAGFLAHQSSLFSTVVILVDMFLPAVKREPARALRMGIACVVCFFIIDGIWFAWSTRFFGVAGTFLSYYERPAAVGGLAGYVTLFTYHVLAAMFSPLFLYDIAGQNLDYLRFLQNLQALSYNSVFGIGTATLFASALAAIVYRISRTREDAPFVQSLHGKRVRLPLLVLSLWAALIAGFLLAGQNFGQNFFPRYFNHPDFARKMFAGYFGAGAVALGLAFFALSVKKRSSAERIPDDDKLAGAYLLYWMAIAGYLGGIITVHEIYIHGTISAGSATAVVLTLLFLARIAADFPRKLKLLLVLPIMAENLLILWFPLLIIRNNWGWAGEKNWALKEQNQLSFLADILADHWKMLGVAGIVLQATLLSIWALAKTKNKGEESGRSIT